MLVSYCFYVFFCKLLLIFSSLSRSYYSLSDLLWGDLATRVAQARHQPSWLQCHSQKVENRVDRIKRVVSFLKGQQFSQWKQASSAYSSLLFVFSQSRGIRVWRRGICSTLTGWCQNRCQSGSTSVLSTNGHDAERSCLPIRRIITISKFFTFVFVDVRFCLSLVI